MRLKWSRSMTTTLSGRTWADGGLDLAPQPLLRAAVVEQPGEAVVRGLVAQVLALACRLVGERRHRGEALDERDLGVGERPVGADAVDVQRPDDAVMGEHRHAHERLVVEVGARHDGADVVEAGVGHVPRAAVAHHPAGRALIDRERLGHDLLDPHAERENRSQTGALGIDLVDGEVVIGQERLQMVRDAREGVLERIGSQNACGGIDEGIQRSAAPLRRLVRGNHNPFIGAGTRQLDR